MLRTEESAPSTLESIRNTVLSFVPTRMAVALHDRLVSPAADKVILNQFISELQNNLHVVGSSPEFVGKLIPEYVSETLLDKLRTDQLLAFKTSLDNDLNQAYDTTHPEDKREFHKASALKKIMLQLDPHGLKYIQSLRPVKPSSWVANAIATVQSDLPAPSLETIQQMMIDDIKAQNPHSKYAKEFSKYFTLVKLLGAGTVGVVVEMKWQDESGKEQIIVGKMNRPNIVEQFNQGNDRLNRAIDILLAQKEVSETEAAGFRNFNNKKLEAELRECNPQVEMVNLAEALYEAPGVTTIRDIKALRGVGKNIIFMEKAKGIGFSKFLRETRKKAVDPTLSPAEREAAYNLLLNARKCFVMLDKAHLKKLSKNQTVHCDLHAGNMFYSDSEFEELLSVFDRASDSIASNAAEHLRLRQFLFAIYLSAGTVDVHYLRLYYEKQHNNDPALGCSPVAPEKIENLLTEIQAKLDEIKRDSREKRVIDVDRATGEVTSIIGNAVLKIDKGLIPDSLALLADSNKKVSDQFDELNKDFIGTPYASKIPFAERTEIMLALDIGRKEDNAGLWTQAAWDHFKKTLRRERGVAHWQFGLENGDLELHYLPEKGEERLQYQKKFVYGIFGLTEEEAQKANVLIPAAIITAPIVLGLGLIKLREKARIVAKHLPDLPDALNLVKLWHSMPGPRESMQSFASRIYTYGSNSQFFNRGAMNSLQLPQKFLQFSGRSPGLFRKVPGVLLGGAMVLGYQKFSQYRADKAKNAESHQHKPSPRL